MRKHSNELYFQYKGQNLNGIRTRDLRVAGALFYQLSYEATHLERDQFIEFIPPVRSEMMWSMSNLSNWKEEAWYFSGFFFPNLKDCYAGHIFFLISIYPIKFYKYVKI